jgi:leucyl aminopeptidase (aminopeptidase T)
LCVNISAQAAVDCLAVGEDDDVLVLCNDPQLAIADAIGEAAGERARSVRVLAFPAGTRHGEEPSPEVSAAMAAATVIFAPTTFSLSHTAARVEATRRGTRMATMPGITEEVFRRALAVDYSELKRAGAWLAAQLTIASSCHVRSAAGTDLTLDLSGREGINDDGDLAAVGAFGNLPAGEAFISPIETSGEGTIVYDGALGGYGLLEQPVVVTLSGGRMVSAVGGDAGPWLEEVLDAGGEHGRSIAELGIGTNPAARLTGNVLEDEKALGTIHLAFGTSAGIGGVNRSTVHIDGLVLRPTVELDGRVLLEDGTLASAA